jgi:hypothetical protein
MRLETQPRSGAPRWSPHTQVAASALSTTLNLGPVWPAPSDAPRVRPRTGAEAELLVTFLRQRRSSALRRDRLPVQATNRLIAAGALNSDDELVWTTRALRFSQLLERAEDYIADEMFSEAPV